MRVAKMRRVTGSEVSDPLAAEAVFSRTPASISSCSIVSVPVQTMEFPGANPPAGRAGHVTFGI